jgi:hypothetical protein
MFIDSVCHRDDDDDDDDDAMMDRSQFGKNEFLFSFSPFSSFESFKSKSLKQTTNGPSESSFSSKLATRRRRAVWPEINCIRG